MHPLVEARHRLVESAGLPALLSAAMSSFEAMRAEIYEQEDKAGPGFAAFALAGVSVAGGWHAIAAAPSLPPAVGSAEQPVTPAQLSDLGEAEAAGELARLALLLVSRLERIATQAGSPGDRSACRDAARHAAAICALLGGAARP